MRELAIKKDINQSLIWGLKCEVAEDIEKLDALVTFKRYQAQTDDGSFGYLTIEFAFEDPNDEVCGDYSYRTIYREYIEKIAKSAGEASKLLHNYISTALIEDSGELGKNKVTLTDTIVSDSFSNNNLIKVPMFADNPDIGNILINYTLLAGNAHKYGIVHYVAFSYGGIVRIHVKYAYTNNKELRDKIAELHELDDNIKDNIKYNSFGSIQRYTNCIRIIEEAKQWKK